MKQKNKKNPYKYAFGDFVKSNTDSLGSPIGAASSILGSAIGGSAGSILSSAGNLTAAGAALGPLGIAGGAVLGAGLGLIGANKQKKAETAARTQKYNNYQQSYEDEFNSELDIDNQNPYGNLSYADGGKVKSKTSVPKDLKWTNLDYTTKKGNLVTQANLDDYKLGGLDFQNNPRALGDYLDSMPIGQSTVNNININPTRNATVYQYDSPDYRNTAGRRYAEGGDIMDNTINIEKGELQIDPNTGKILREYTGINPETGGLYQPHSKGKDPLDNMVLAEPGTFIITKAKAKKYKDSIDTNDKIAQDTILQNIRNFKTKSDKSNKMATGGGVKPNYLFAPGEQTNNPDIYNPRIAPISPVAQMNTSLATGNFGTPPTQSNNTFSKVGDYLTQYGPSLLNIGKGLFGDVEQQANISPNINPYKSQILNNLPQDIDFNPVRQEAIRQQNTAFNQIDNTTSSSPVARANKTNLFANTQNVLGKLAMENQINNNQVKSQKAGIYSNLGNQELNELARVQGINLGIDENNRANRSAKDNLLATGLSQLQQTALNNKTNARKGELDQYQVDLLKQIFPSINPYFDTTFNPNKKRG